MVYRMTQSQDRKRSQRPSPSASAAECPVGKVCKGNDGRMYVVRRDARGVKRWSLDAVGGREEVEKSAVKPPERVCTDGVYFCPGSVRWRGERKEEPMPSDVMKAFRVLLADVDSGGGRRRATRRKIGEECSRKHKPPLSKMGKGAVSQELRGYEDAWKVVGGVGGSLDPKVVREETGGNSLKTDREGLQYWRGDAGRVAAGLMLLTQKSVYKSLLSDGDTIGFWIMLRDWRWKHRPVADMSAKELSDEFERYTNAWEWVTTKNTDSGSVQGVRALRSAVSDYRSDESRAQAAAWLMQKVKEAVKMKRQARKAQE